MDLRRITIKEISSILKIRFIGENLELNALNLYNRESIYDKILTYIDGSKYLSTMEKRDEIKAAFISNEDYKLAPKELLKNKSFFIVDKPEKYFYSLQNYLFSKTNFYDKFKFKRKIGDNSFIHPTAFVEDGVIIGDNVNIGPKAYINKGTIVGNNVSIAAGAVIGSEGFQVLFDEETPYMVKHSGGVKIGNNVTIGSNTCVSNSLFEGFTVINENTKIDNLVHVAHNCVIGKNSVITAGVILSGSTIIRNNVWIAPNSTILNKVIIESGSLIGIGSVVLKKVKEGSRVFGNPSKEI